MQGQRQQQVSNHFEVNVTITECLVTLLRAQDVLPTPAIWTSMRDIATSGQGNYYIFCKIILSLSVYFLSRLCSINICNIIVQEITQNVANVFSFYAIIAIEHGFSMH